MRFSRLRSGQFEPGRFGPADAGRVEKLENGPVPDAQRIGNVRQGQDGFDLGHAQRLDREPLLRPGQLEIACRVGLDDVLLAEPGEERFDRSQPATL